MAASSLPSAIELIKGSGSRAYGGLLGLWEIANVCDARYDILSATQYLITES